MTGVFCCNYLNQEQNKLTKCSMQSKREAKW